jgi:hypothetical protein
VENDWCKVYGLAPALAPGDVSESNQNGIIHTLKYGIEKGCLNKVGL